LKSLNILIEVSSVSDPEKLTVTDVKSVAEFADTLNPVNTTSFAP
jgi:hypothetical protein